MTLTYVFLLTILTWRIGGEYLPQIAKEMAQLSRIAYYEGEIINSWNCTECEKYPLFGAKVFKDDSTELQGYTGYSPKTGIVVVFRGTTNADNWITNLNIKKVNYSRCNKCKVHDGFYDAWQALQNDTYLQVQQLKSQYRTAPISLTGHSLGGAIATLAAADLKQILGQIQNLYTFGQPRVGNNEFAAYFQTIATSFRVVHYADIVPHLPWASLGFAHQGTEVWYDKPMTNYVVCQEGQSPTCSNSLPFKNYNAKDHRIAIYVTLPANFYQYFTQTIENLFQQFKVWVTGTKLQEQSSSQEQKEQTN